MISPIPASTLDAAARSLEAGGLTVHRDEPMARRGFWRIGGPADLFVEIPDAAGLQRVLETGLPVTIAGNGSNMLVADAGVRGIVIRLVGEFRSSSVSPTPAGPVLEAGGGLLNTVLLRRLDRADLAGLGCLAGVPGTLGGAIRMNAGTSLGEIGDAVQRVALAMPDGTHRILEHGELGFGYRRATLPEGAVVVRAWITVTDQDLAERRAQARRHLDRRKATQPLDKPSCGSVFKNPEGDYAGRLIEDVGLKGATAGGACISPRHANFIVNRGGATAADVYSLVTRARAAVFARHGTVLEPEVKPAGDWPEGAWPLPDPG